MDDNNDNILAQIQELRAEAGENLQGNEYFAVACKLDALIAGGDPDGPEAQEALETIRARYFSHNGAQAAPAAEADVKPAIAEVQALYKEAAEKLHGNAYFTLAQKLDALLAAEDLDAPDIQKKLQEIGDELIAASAQPAKGEQNEIIENIIALRAQAGEKLHGNAYFDIAHRLDALLASEDPGAASVREMLEEIRSLIETKQPAAAAQPASAAASQQAPETKADAETDPEVGMTIPFPKANSFSSPQATVAVRFADEEEVESIAAETVADTQPEQGETPADAEPKSGFDALTEASWRRVREVAGPDEIPVQHVNGAAADGMSTAQWEPVVDAEEAPAQTAEVDTAEIADVAPEVMASTAETTEEVRAEIAETPASVPEQEIAPVEMAALETASPEVSEPELETQTAAAGEEAQEAFKVTPRPNVINRPVKKEGFARLKRLAKLPFQPKRKG